MKKGNEVITAFDRYVISGQLGQGGAGTVYAATDSVGQDVAIKVLNASGSSSEVLRRFKNEIHFCRQDRHPQIIRVLDHGVSPEGDPFLVMPRYSGSLRTILNDLDASEGHRVGLELLNAVEAAHLLGVTHRDLKPENVLVSADRSEIVLTDFGIARFSREDLLTAVRTRVRSRLANFRYAAPEQRRPGGSVDGRADIYALGLILNELFTGEVPQGTGFRAIGDAAPDFGYLDEVVERMIAQEPASRYGSVSEVKKVISLKSGQYLAQQKVSELADRKVVSADRVEDPLFENSLQIMDVDWEDDVLTLTLSQPVSDKWVSALRNMGSYSSVMGCDPQAFRFKGRKARVGVSARDAQRVIDHFKNWLPKAAAVYKYQVEQEAKLVEERKRNALDEERRRAEERAELLDNLNF